MIDNLKVMALIPARGGSKGIPGKNIIEVDGKPLISYSIKHAIESKLCDRVIVSSDSDENTSHFILFVLVSLSPHIDQRASVTSGKNEKCSCYQ